MVNRDEVFVITEDDILKSPDRGKNKAAASRGAPISLAKNSAKAGRAEGDSAPEAVPPVERDKSSGRRRNPAAASTLSLWVWGLGQLYNGDTKLAVLLMLSEALVVAFHYMLYTVWRPLCNFAYLFFISEAELVLYMAAIDFCLLFFAIYNVAQAYHGAEARGGRFSGLHRPLVAGLASLLVPGWGQMLNGQLGKGVTFLFSFLLQAYLIGLYMVSPFYRVVIDLDPQEILLKKAIWVGMGVLFCTALSWLISAYDATLVARYTRKA